MPATKTDNMLSSLRLGVIERLALSFWAGTLPEDVDRIPLLMRPRGSEIMSRCCIYKDRAILRERLRAAMGFRLEDETDDSIPLRTYAEEALERKEPNWPILTVCDIACQGCVARSCIGSCRFGAISFSRGRSTIDPEKCRNCGMCMDACPYHAIVRLNVPCEAACPVRAIHKGNKGRAEIDFEKCTSCGRCMRACPFGAVMERSEVLPVLRALASGRHVTALMAPAIVGQFPGGPARIVTALRRLGFSDVMEVALGADVTSQREAAEFVERMERGLHVRGRGAARAPAGGAEDDHLLLPGLCGSRAPPRARAPAPCVRDRHAHALYRRDRPRAPSRHRDGLHRPLRGQEGRGRALRGHRGRGDDL